MAAVSEPGPDSGSTDPYGRLGLSPGANFEAVQDARKRCLDNAADDPQEKARVEAAYDAVLMSRLRDRQGGQVSQAAATASVREQSDLHEAKSASRPGVGVIQRLRSTLPDPVQSMSGLTPQWSLAQGRGLVVRLVGGGGILALLVLSPGSSQLALSFALIGSFLSSVRRGRRALSALGLSLLILTIGLVAGAVLLALVPTTALSALPLNPEQLQAIPAALLLWITALFLA